MAINIAPLIKKSFQESLIKKCHNLLFFGYRDLLIAKTYSCDWDEDNFSASLIEHMKNLSLASTYAISINPQSPIYSTAILQGKKRAKRAPVIDFKFSTWSGQTEYMYFMEAKNLSDTNWKKISGSKVSAQYYQNRYITSGINNFQSGKYSNGCLIGYCVQGKPVQIAAKINLLLTKKLRHKEVLTLYKNSKGIFHYNSILPKSTGDEELLHFFLMLN